VLGLALGDALGAPFASRRARDVPDPLPAYKLPWRGGPAGSTTDDTAMARNLVRSLGQQGLFDPDDLVARHLDWFLTDPPHVGTVTRRSLRLLARGVSSARAAPTVWAERGPEVSADNGSVMYCAPLGAAYANRVRQVGGLARALSALTHWDERCRTACQAVAVATALVVQGTSGPDAVGAAVAGVADREGGEELEFLVETAGARRPVDGPDQGFCLYAAGLGLQAVIREGDFESELRRVVGFGGDTGTNAAVAGALLGARVGRSGLPPTWLARLRDRQEIEAEAERLVPLAAMEG
jgi:ADP-ribosylglycohydrolase